MLNFRVERRASPTQWPGDAEPAQAPSVEVQLQQPGVYNDTSAIRIIPTELLTEILRLAVGDTPIFIPAPTYTTPANLPPQQLLIPSLVISHVCRRWRYLAIATVWSHFTFFHHPRWRSYPLSRLEEVVSHFLTRIPPTRPLEIQLLMDGETPPGSVASFVLGNRERLAGAELELGEDDLREFWRLGEGEGVYPVMRRLKITFVEEEGEEEEDGGPAPEEGRTRVSRMAPRLTSFSYTAWEGDVDPFAFGLDFERLEELELRARVPEEGIYALLPRLAEIRRLGMGIDAQPYEEWRLGRRDEGTHLLPIRI
ncbi:hypothetical protein R3P38DRAFT_3444725 [Favolaschia claudopus]|uniref:F-box domain-containing protein n=1 Tax=Favolaschia claudopus TaxID=2862362 RepID=A0AAV9ZNU1_9AGAR